MWTWDEVREACEHPETNARDAALLAVAWDAGPRSGELKELTLGDISDHDVGNIIHVDGKTGERDVTITNAVPYMRQWLNQHPGTNADGRPEAPGIPLWSKLKKPEGVSYRLYRDVFSDAAERIGIDKPDDPTQFRKSSASALASKGFSQSHLEKRYGWTRGSDAATRYIRVFGEDADRELAEARGMDVDLGEPEPDGPKSCKRCGVLINQAAEKCDNCGFIQDRENAQETISPGTAGADLQQMINEEIDGQVEKRAAEIAGNVIFGIIDDVFPNVDEEYDPPSRESFSMDDYLDEPA
jgi:hypothetical protein